MDVGLNSDSESEAGVEVKVLEATPVLHESEEENESEEEDEVVEHTEAAHAAVRQAEAEGLTLQPADNKAGYRGVYKEGCKATFRAKVRRAGKSMHLGSFSTAEEAALAYARTPEARGEVATSTLRRSRPKRQWSRRQRKGSISSQARTVRQATGESRLRAFGTMHA